MILDLSFELNIPVIDWFAIDFVAAVLAVYIVYSVIKFVVSLVTG